MFTCHCEEGRRGNQCDEERYQRFGQIPAFLRTARLPKVSPLRYRYRYRYRYGRNINCACG